MFNKLNSNPQDFLKFIRGYAKFLGEFYNRLFDDFISKKPQFKPIKLLLYQGQDKDILKKANEILRTVGRDKYIDITTSFHEFINNLLVDVAGKGTIAGSGKKKGGMCPCLKK